jgi:hypothetical protein
VIKLDPRLIGEKEKYFMVRCKFKVYEKGERASWNKEEPNPCFVKMSPVQGEPFGKYTPSGNIEMTIINDEAAKQFDVGKEYFIDITLAE